MTDSGATDDAVRTAPFLERYAVRGADSDTRLTMATRIHAETTDDR